MIKIQYKKHLIGLTAFFLCANPLLSYAADSSDVSESRIKSESERLTQLENSRTNLESYMGDLNSQLSELSDTLSSLDASQKKKEEEIETVHQELESAKEQEAKQYASMKKRIKYIYENDDLDILSIIFGSDNIADFLNKLDFVIQISSYDREMLDELEKIRETIAKTEQTLQEEKQELAELESETAGQQNTVSAMLSKASSQLLEFDSDISSAKQQITKYEEELKQKEAALAKTETQPNTASENESKAKSRSAEKKETARKEDHSDPRKSSGSSSEKSSASSKPSSGSSDKSPSSSGSSASGNGSSSSGDSGSSSGGNSESHSNLELLAAIIECEAGGEIYEGKIAVGNVVMNRVRSSSYPNTILSVLYQKGQFGPVSSGRFALVLARGAGSSCTQAARDVMNGKNNIGSLLHFGAPSGGTGGIVIGNHVFY